MLYIACFGDSLIQGFPFGKEVSWVAQLEATQEIKALNYGLCGDCADDIFDRLRFVHLPENVSHIVFLGGANDVIQGVPEKFTLGIFKKLADWCVDKNYKLCIVLPFVTSDECLNRRILNLRQELELKFKNNAYLLDLQPAIGLDSASRAKAYLDGVHPTADIYKKIGEYALPLVLEWLKSHN